jgi:hypothetical protein
MIPNNKLAPPPQTSSRERGYSRSRCLHLPGRLWAVATYLKPTEAVGRRSAKRRAQKSRRRRLAAWDAVKKIDTASIRLSRIHSGAAITRAARAIELLSRVACLSARSDSNWCATCSPSRQRFSLRLTPTERSGLNRSVYAHSLI